MQMQSSRKHHNGVLLSIQICMHALHCDALPRQARTAAPAAWPAGRGRRAPAPRAAAAASPPGCHPAGCAAGRGSTAWCGLQYNMGGKGDGQSCRSEVLVAAAACRLPPVHHRRRMPPARPVHCIVTSADDLMQRALHIDIHMVEGHALRQWHKRLWVAALQPCLQSGDPHLCNHPAPQMCQRRRRSPQKQDQAAFPAPPV